jgi:hypothetical protein
VFFLLNHEVQQVGSLPFVLCQRCVPPSLAPPQCDLSPVDKGWYRSLQADLRNAFAALLAKSRVDPNCVGGGRQPCHARPFCMRRAQCRLFGACWDQSCA